MNDKLFVGIAQNPMLGVRFVKLDGDYQNLVGQRIQVDYWDLMEKRNLHYIDVGQNDRVYFYGNKELDICFKFEEDWQDDILFLHLTGVFHYPEIYEKSNEEINYDLINAAAMQMAIKKEVQSLIETGKSIDANTYNDCQIDAYVNLRDNGRLK